MKWLGRIGFLLSLLAVSGLANAQTAALLPDGIQQYFDNNGKPLANGSVGYYVPSTTTPKTTWTTSSESGPVQPNPIPLGISGRPSSPIYGDGTYRQIVKDQFGNTIWDYNTASTGSGGGSAPAFSEGVMVGTIIPWANTTLPAKYLYTAGQAISRTTYSALFTALTYNPSILCSQGIATITVSSSISDTVPIGAPVEFSCFAPGTVVSSKTSGQLTLSTSATVTASVSGFIFPWGNGDGSTTFNVPDLRGRAIVGRDNMNSTAAGRVSSTFFGANPDANDAVGGQQSITLAQGNLPSILPTGNVSGGIQLLNVQMRSASTTGSNDLNTISAGATGGTVLGAVPLNIFSSLLAATFTGVPIGGGTASSATIAAAGSGFSSGTQLVTLSGGTCTIQPTFNVTVVTGAMTSPVVVNPGSCTIPPANPATVTGGGGTGGQLTVTYAPIAISNVQPSLTADYIIKALPDDVPGGPGVTSLQSMTGAITCGAGLVCNAQTISTNIPSFWGVPQGGTGQSSFTANLPLLGNGTSPLLQGTISGNTTKFGTVSGTLTPGDCLKSDASGNIVDNGSTCPSGVNQAFTQNFIAGAGFTAGTTTSLTLSGSPASAATLLVAFDGVVQAHDTWNLAGAVVTFNAAIPANVNVVEAQWQSSTTVAGVGSLTDSSGNVASGAITVTAPFAISGGNTLGPGGACFLSSRTVAANSHLSACLVVMTGGYAQAGDAGGAYFKKVGSNPFIDSPTSSVIVNTAGTGCTAGSYFGYDPQGGTGQGLEVNFTIGGGGTMTAVSITGTGGGAYTVNDVLTFTGPAPAVPGCSVQPTIKVTAVSNPLGSFTDLDGNHWQITSQEGAGVANIRQFGAVQNYTHAGGDAAATNDQGAIQACLRYVSVGNYFSDSGGYGGGTCIVPSGASLVCNGLLIPASVTLKGTAPSGSMLKQCDADDINNTNFVSLGDPNNHKNAFCATVDSLTLFGGGSSPGTAFMIYSNNSQCAYSINNVAVYSVSRGCLKYEIGYGGPSGFGWHGGLCVPNGALSPSPAINLSGNFGFTFDQNWQTSVGGPTWSGTAILLGGGGTFKMDSGAHCENLTICVEYDGTVPSPMVVSIVSAVGFSGLSRMISIKSGSITGNIGLQGWSANGTTCNVYKEQTSTCLSSGNTGAALVTF